MVLVDLIKKGPRRFFHVKQRKERPAILDDPSLGQHATVQLKVGGSGVGVDKIRPVNSPAWGKIDVYLKKNYSIYISVVCIATIGTGKSVGSRKSFIDEA